MARRIRLNALWQDSDTPGRDVVENTRWGVAPSVALGLRTPTRLTASYFRLQQDDIPDYGLPWVPGHERAARRATRIRRRRSTSDNFYGMRNRDYEKTDDGSRDGRRRATTSAPR